MRLTKNKYEIVDAQIGSFSYVVRRTNRPEGNYFLFPDGRFSSQNVAQKKYGSWDNTFQAMKFPTHEAAQEAVDKYLTAKAKPSKNKLIKEKIGKIKQWLDELGWSKNRTLPDSGAANYGGWPMSDGTMVSLKQLVYDLIDTAGIGDFPQCDDKEFSRRMRLGENNNG